MHQNDFEGFQRQLAKLSDVFGKKLTDDTVQAYWGALKDQSLPTITRLADEHTRHAKFFPKPHELRPREERKKEADAKDIAAFRACVENSRRMWDEFFVENPARAEIELGIARAARTMVTQLAGTPEYEQARKDDWRWREARREMFEKQRVNVA